MLWIPKQVSLDDCAPQQRLERCKHSERHVVRHMSLDSLIRDHATLGITIPLTGDDDTDSRHGLNGIEYDTTVWSGAYGTNENFACHPLYLSLLCDNHSVLRWSTKCSGHTSDLLCLIHGLHMPWHHHNYSEMSRVHCC